LRELTPTVTRVLTQSCGGSVDPRALLELSEPLFEVPELARDPVLEPLPRPRQTFGFPELGHGEPPASEPHPAPGSRGQRHGRRPRLPVAHVPDRHLRAGLPARERVEDLRRVADRLR